jgi:hypothetical protein
MAAQHFKKEPSLQQALNGCRLPLRKGMQMVQQRIPPDTLANRLPKEAAQFNEVAAKLPSEKYARELKLKRVEQAETASNINKWLGSKICGKVC